MTLIEILITVISLCSAGTGGIAFKCLYCPRGVVQEEKEEHDDNIRSMDVEHGSNHSVEAIISQVVEQHKRNSKEGSELETHVDITINVHSFSREERVNDDHKIMD